MSRNIKLKKVAVAIASVFTLTLFSPGATVIAEFDIPSMPDFSYIGTVGSLSDQQSKIAAETVYESLYFHKDAVDFSSRGVKMTNSNADDLIAIYRHVSSCYDVGILVKKGVISYSPYSSTISLSYLFSGSEYSEKYSEYSSMLDEILSGVDYSWSEEEKALYLHDYLAVRFDYDYPAYYGAVTRNNKEQYSAYGMLKNGLAVCEGYSELYAKLLNRLGIETQLVTSDELRHAWNIVRINGSRYFVDVAWDDSFLGYKGIVKHDNFLRTAEEMKNCNHETEDWKDVFGNSLYNIEVPDNFSSAFWLGTKKAIKRYDNGWLAMVGTVKATKAELYKYDGGTHSVLSSKTLASLPSSASMWFVWGSDRSYWTESFNIPEVTGGTAYYSTPTAIYAIYKGKSIKVYELNASEKSTGYIYGMYAEDGKLYYGLDTERHNVDMSGTVPVKYNSASVRSLEKMIAAETGEAYSKTTTTTTTTTVTTTKKPTTTTTTTVTTTKKPTTTTATTVTTTKKPTTTTTTAVTTTKKLTTTTTTTVTTMKKPTTTTTITVTTTKKPTTTATTTVITTVTTTTLPPEKKGDVDGDGQTNAVDASLILSHYARISTGGRAELSREQQLAADANGDGFIDAVDASCILGYYAFLSTHTETLSIDAYLDRRRMH
ncbi:dockerin type I domain-containing protein [Ruminococcus sp.]|uniref:dockerin type I domain-containing protein n=1 Tax=Ruminococcus sp. TaxID=41978 RepID=UPI001B782572|nr:dockerin type I domain-containing protein [Ruminococcus sp.]MBP5434127.1 hypothetical protein [Ruminococcus sp.]